MHTVASGTGIDNCLERAADYQQLQGGRVVVVRRHDNQQLHAINYLPADESKGRHVGLLVDASFAKYRECPTVADIQVIARKHWGKLVEVRNAIR